MTLNPDGDEQWIYTITQIHSLQSGLWRTAC
jgi:hypothetical protein